MPTKYVFIVLIMLSPCLLWAQEDSNLHFSGYLETYYSYDFNQPENHNKPDFLKQYHRHNEFNVNLAILQVHYQNKNIRAKLGLMGGTFSQKVREEEPLWAKFIHQANVGVKIDDGLWLDVGVMPSHFGSEGVLGKDNWTLSPSVLAENVPYYFTGARLTYDKTDRWEFLLWLTNGWQKIQKPDRFQSLGVGIGVKFKPLPDIEISYNNYLGNEAPQTMKLFRLFNNIYTKYEWGKWGAIVRLDYGLEDHPFATINEWWGVKANLRRSINNNFNLGIRASYIKDNNGVVMQDPSKLGGVSLNLDYKLTESAMARVEVKRFNSPDPMFEKPAGKLSKSNTVLNVALSIGL